MSRLQQKGELLQKLGDVLLNPHSSNHEREKAKQALERLADGTALTHLAQLALASESPHAITQVLDLLETRRGLTEVEAVLVGFLYDSSPEVRQKAMRILASKGTLRMLFYLDEIIKGALKESSIFGPEDAAVASQARQRIADRGDS